MVAALKPEKTSPHDQKKLSTDIPRIPDDLKFNPLVDSALEAAANATIDETSFGAVVSSQACRRDRTTPWRRVRRRGNLFPLPAWHGR
jgi:hypothetical protein